MRRTLSGCAAVCWRCFILMNFHGVKLENHFFLLSSWATWMPTSRAMTTAV